MLLPGFMVNDRKNLATFPEILEFFHIEDPKFAGARLEILALYYLLRDKI